MRKFTVYSLQFTVWLRAWVATVNSKQSTVNGANRMEAPHAA